MAEWIRTDDASPAEGDSIWIFRPLLPRGMDPVDRIARLTTNRDDPGDWLVHWGITHWMPCETPEPPNLDEKGRGS